MNLRVSFASRAAWWLLALTIGVAVVSSSSPGQPPSAQTRKLV